MPHIKIYKVQHFNFHLPAEQEPKALNEAHLQAHLMSISLPSSKLRSFMYFQDWSTRLYSSLEINFKVQIKLEISHVYSSILS